jgi:hypothetical protein
MPNPPEWWREKYIPFHRSKARDVQAKGMKVDFQIRPHKNKADTYIFLEIKQKWSVQECISQMVNDLNKLYRGKGPEINNARGFWAMGVHKRESKREVENKIRETAEGWLEKEMFITRAIPNTKFAYTIF